MGFWDKPLRVLSKAMPPSATSRFQQSQIHFKLTNFAHQCEITNHVKFTVVGALALNCRVNNWNKPKQFTANEKKERKAPLLQDQEKKKNIPTSSVLHVREVLDASIMVSVIRAMSSYLVIRGKRVLELTVSDVSLCLQCCRAKMYPASLLSSSLSGLLKNVNDSLW